MKIAVADRDLDHQAVARMITQVGGPAPDGDDQALSESGRGLQIIAAMFPGACGAEPARTSPGFPAAKQVWISLPVPGQALP